MSVEEMGHRLPGTYLIPRGHLLFAVFDDRAAADRAAAGVEATDAHGVWVFAGPAGVEELDPDAVVRGWLAEGRRLFTWLFSSNLEYLRALADGVRQGTTVVAVHVADDEEAQRLARRFRRAGGHSFAYATHGNFVPVMP